MPPALASPSLTVTGTGATSVNMAVVTTLLLVAAALLTQSRPNLSGRWMVDYDRSRGPGPQGQVTNMRVLNESFVAEQTAETLVLAIDNEMGLKSIYRLDGADSENMSLGPRGRVVKTISRATWSGSTLTITTRSAEDASVRGFLKLTMNPDATIRAEGGPGDGQDVRMVSVYKRFPKG